MVVVNDGRLQLEASEKARKSLSESAEEAERLAGELREREVCVVMKRNDYCIFFLAWFDEQNRA